MLFDGASLDTLGFGPELAGRNWYAPERMAREHEGLAYYRWCGRLPTASIRFIGRDATAVRLVCDCVSVIHGDVLDAVSFTIDDMPAAHQVRRGAVGAAALSIEVEGQRSTAAPISELVLHLAVRRSPEALGVNKDARMLALAVKRVKVFVRAAST